MCEDLAIVCAERRHKRGTGRDEASSLFTLDVRSGGENQSNFWCCSQAFCSNYQLNWRVLREEEHFAACHDSPEAPFLYKYGRNDEEIKADFVEAENTSEAKQSCGQTTHNWRLVANRKKPQTADGASIKSVDSSVTFPVMLVFRTERQRSCRLSERTVCQSLAVGITRVHSKEETIHFLFLNSQTATFWPRWAFNL